MYIELNYSLIFILMFRKDLIVTYKDKNKKEKTMGTISHPFNWYFL